MLLMVQERSASRAQRTCQPFELRDAAGARRLGPAAALWCSRPWGLASVWAANSRTIGALKALLASGGPPGSCMTASAIRRSRQAGRWRR